MSQAGSFVNSGGGSGGIQSINTDNGTATPNTGIITIAGGTNINTEGSGSTITVNLDDSVNLIGSLTAGTFIDIPRTTSPVDGVIQQDGAPFIHSYTDPDFSSSNIFIGYNSGNFSLTSFGNIGIGNNTGSNLTTGAYNNIFGNNAGTDLTTGSENCLYGTQAGSSLTDGDYNNIFGSNAGFNLTTGNSNCLYGELAGSSLTTGNNNIAIGNFSGSNITFTNNNIHIGNSGVSTDNGVIRIGTNGTHTSCFIAGNTIINGSLIATTTITAGTGLTVTSGNLNIPRTTSPVDGVIQQDESPFIHSYTDSSTGEPLNIFIGSTSGNFSLTKGGNIGIGQSTGRNLTTGSSNNLFGTNAGVNLTTGSGNCLYGALAGLSLTTGGNNIAIGPNAGSNITTTNNNIHIGNTGVVTDNGTIRIGANGTHNSCFIAGNTTINGYLAASTTLTAGTGLTITNGNLNTPNTTSSSIGVINKGGASFIHNFGAAGDFNTFVGSGAGNFTLTSGTATVNTGIGAGSLAALTTGAGNTGFGTSSLSGVTTGNNNIAIGNSAGNNITTTSNNINIANTGVVTDSGTIRIGTNSTHTSCFIQGIRNVTPSATDVAPMIIDTNGQLGTVPAVASWTPVLNFGVSSTGITYNIRTGSYYKIGKAVYITCSISLSSKGTATGITRITGLPFTIQNDTVIFPMGNFSITQPPGTTQFYGIINPGGSAILLQAAGSNSISSITDAQFSDNSQFTLSGFYFTS